MVKNPTCQCRNCRRLVFNSWLERSPGGGNGNPLQYSCSDNPMERGVWWATVHGIAKSQIWLSDWAPVHTIYGLQSAFLYSKLLNPCKYPINCCCLVNKLCLTLWNPMDHSLLGFSFRGISQARMLLFIRSVVPDSLQPHGTSARQGSWFFTISQSLLKHMSIESVMPSNHLIPCHPFSSCPQSFLASGFFPMSRLFTSGGQSTGASVSVSVLPMNIQGWFSFRLTGLISLLSKELSRVFSSTTVQKHQFFGAQPSLWSNSHIHMWLLGKHKQEYYSGLPSPSPGDLPNPGIETVSPPLGGWFFTTEPPGKPLLF